MHGTEDKKEVKLSDYKKSEFLIDHVDLTLDLDDKETLVSSHLEIVRNAEADQSCKDLTLDGEALVLQSVALNGKLLSPDEYVVTDHYLKIINVPDTFNLDIVTKINPEANTELHGLYKSKDNFCTHCEAEGFRRITYFLDRPDVMATYTTKIIADEKKYPMLLSNGNLVDKGKIGDKHWITWNDPYKKPSYLYALVAGDLELLQDTYVTSSGKKINLHIFCEKGYVGRLTYAMESLKKSMAWDEVNYGREYDLEDYKIVAVTDFNMGAMENKGLNIFNARYLLASPESSTDSNYTDVTSTVGHEYFHNWTGNRITLRDWFQLSLKEGLTTFREQSFSEDNVSVVERINDVYLLRTKQFPEDAGPLAHPVRPPSYIEIDNFYTTTIYKKGAEIYRMLQTVLGKDVFRKGMDLYFQQHDGQAVIIEQFIKSLEEASGKDLSQFLLWFSQAGTPTLKAEDNYDPSTQTYTLKLSQVCAPTPGQPDKKALPIPVKMGLLDEQGNVISFTLKNETEIKQETVLLLTEASKEFYFTNVRVKPVPSLLRHFTAPVKLQYPYTMENLQLLSKHDGDLFNRWDAMHNYVMTYLLELINNYKNKKPVTISADFIDVFRALLNNKQGDLTLQAMMLTIPEESVIADHMACVNPEAVCHVRKLVTSELAANLHEELLATYKRLDELDDHDGKMDLAKAGIRSLKNTCLDYLVSANDCAMKQLARVQFDSTLQNNMTNAYAALYSLAQVNGEEKNLVLAKFYAQWKHDPIVLSKWFAVQAAARLPDTLDNIKELMTDKTFDLKNASLVRSLIRPFIANLNCFHDASGKGYEFLTGLIIKINAKNAVLAAEFTEYYSCWKKYADPQKSLMRDQLVFILKQDNLSSNVYEIAKKSLGEDLVLKKTLPRALLAATSTLYHQPKSQMDNKITSDVLVFKP